MSHLFRAITKILIFTNSLWDELSLGEYYGKESLYFCSAPMTFPYILHRYLLLAAAGSRTVAKMDFLCFLIWYSVFPGLNLTSRSRHLWDLTNWAMKIIKKKKYGFIGDICSTLSRAPYCISVCAENLIFSLGPICSDREYTSIWP